MEHTIARRAGVGCGLPVPQKTPFAKMVSCAQDRHQSPRRIRNLNRAVLNQVNPFERIIMAVDRFARHNITADQPRTNRFKVVPL